MASQTSNQVFLSYSEENEDFVESLAMRLREDARLSFWFRPWHAVPGEDIQEQMDKALGEAQSCAVFVGSGEIKGWQNDQMRAAIQARVEDDPTYRVIPVLLPGTARPSRRDMPRFLRLYEPVEFRGPDDERAFQYLLSGILGIPPIEVEGFLEAERGRTSPASPVDGRVAKEPLARSRSGGLHIDPAAPPIRTIRKLLLAAFDSDTLYRFCEERSDFRDVLTSFGSGRILGNMVDDVITHCRRFLLWDTLLAEVAQENHRQFARFEAELRAESGAGPAGPLYDGRSPVISSGRGDLRRPAPAVPPTGPIRNRWALLVGVNRYVDPAFPRLKFCVNDVVALDKVLRSQGYTTVVLHDDLPLQDPRFPTRDNVEAELIRLCQAAEPDDLLWAHFACHGKLVDGIAVLITNEIRAPTLAKRALPLADVEKQMRSNARRVVLTLDACHTGVEVGRDIADPEFIRNAYELAEGFALIAASTAQQIAQEWEEKQHGVFTYYLLEGLSGRADRAKRRFVTVSDLTTHVLDGLRRWNVEHGGLLQEPTARTEMMGDIILADYRDE
jgi:hypothetical protein